MLVLDVNGVQQSVSLWHAAIAMIDQQEWLLAMLVAMTTVVAPVLHLGAMLYLLIPVVNRKRPWAVGWVFRALHANQGWLMLEVFFLSVLVTAVKLSDMAQVTPGWSLFSFMALMLVMTAVSILFDADVYWRAVDLCPTQP